MLTDSEQLALSEAMDFLREAAFHSHDRNSALHYIQMAADAIDAIDCDGDEE